jgi:hypothetical protein
VTVQSRHSRTGNDDARARVVALFKSRGPAVADDARNFDALLRDTFAGQFGWQRRTLVAAAQEAVPMRLRQTLAGGSGQRLLVSQLAEHLRSDAAIDASAARWAVETLAAGLFAAQQETAVDEQDADRTSSADPVDVDATTLATLRRADAARKGVLFAAGGVVLALLVSMFLAR